MNMTIRDLARRYDYMEETAVRIQRYYTERLKNCTVEAKVLPDNGCIEIIVTANVNGIRYRLNQGAFNYMGAQMWDESEGFRRARLEQAADWLGRLVFLVEIEE
jgi:hypothetical protein